MRYETFIRVLDKIRAEAPAKNTRYSPDADDLVLVNQARARAFIHLFLKVSFGITDFALRERNVTDGAYDGGIDGYYIDSETLTIYMIQSKFRATEKNFESKQIDLAELLAMDIDKIISGDACDSAGIEYNGKIKQFQREISEIPDVARYRYKIILLANLEKIAPANIRKFTDGHSVEIFNYERTYQELVFPVVSGNYFTASDIVIPIDLSNKNAGSKISYNVKTRFSDCEITVLFVPTIEVAKMMHKYKNAILKYNPRSYLDLEGQNVNAAIRRTIVDSNTNEFALFNNGLTMLSEETNINEKIGQKNKAQLRIKNPQIINGGQTSFTLSRIYSENISGAEEIFADKEVLLKIITLLADGTTNTKIELIDEISNATNKQTPVINADRLANEEFHKEIQKRVFEKFGFLYERKRGEFSDGLKDGYVTPEAILERNQFWRLCFASNGKINRGFQKKLFQRNDFSGLDLSKESTLDRLRLAVPVFRRLQRDLKPHQRAERDIYALMYAYIEIFSDCEDADESLIIERNLVEIKNYWLDFLANARKKSDSSAFKVFVDDKGELKSVFSTSRYMRSTEFERDLLLYFAELKTKLQSGRA